MHRVPSSTSQVLITPRKELTEYNLDWLPENLVKHRLLGSTLRVLVQLEYAWLTRSQVMPHS